VTTGEPAAAERAGAAGRHVLPLAASPRSAGDARRFVRRLLDDAGRGSWSEAASLAVSELVTNAVLHAHTEVELTVVTAGDHLRIEVRDDNPALPAARSYDDHATTGRGLGLVAAVSDTHGIESLGGAGKVVWCSISAGLAEDELAAQGAGTAWDDQAELAVAPVAPAAPDAVPVQLRQMPATLWLAAREHHDALLRELALLRLAADASADLSDVAPAAVDAARARLDAVVDADLERARDAGVAAVPLPQYHPGALPAVPPTMQLVLQVRPSDAEDFARLQDVLDEGERLAADGRLLVRPGLPEVVAVRDWACEQVIAQVGGAPAGPWPGVDDARFTGDVDAAAAPAGWDDAPVREAAVGAIAVDDANRVVAVSRPLAALLQWAPAELVGRRVVAIIPPRYREAHVAGFTRHLATGDARALGVDLDLPVLRADGTELACRFLIESTPTPTGRIVYVAWISPLEDLAAASG
jgi:PAS domain S-box-containing protein